MNGPTISWSVQRRCGRAADLHALDLPEPTRRAVWVLVPDRPALVLGSTQRDTVVDDAAMRRHAVDLVRRRSGGGAVLLDAAGVLGAARTLWVDLVIPRDDPLWVDDVGRSTDWLGAAWVRALSTLGVAAAVHRGRLGRTEASTLVCFAGLGPGEVVVDGRKVVGISQRRTRLGARFQCVVHLAPDPIATTATPGAERIVDLLIEPRNEADRAALGAQLRGCTARLTHEPDVIIAAVLAALPPR